MPFEPAALPDLLKPGPNSGPTAFLVHEDQVYIARHRRSPGEPRTPVTELIQGIYDLDPIFARKILRKRIFTTYEPTEMCFGMIKVAAKSVLSLNSLTPSGELQRLPTGLSRLPVIAVAPLP